MILTDLSNLPFYCWDCITISTYNRDIDLVIKNEKDMMHLVEFLLVSLNSVDGKRDTAMEILPKANNSNPTGKMEWVKQLLGCYT